MDRLRSGFHHRKSRKDSPSRPTIITDTTSSGKTTPEQTAYPQQPLQVPSVPTKKPSPFRALRDLSRSHKRARSPATGSETNSPVSAISALSARDSPIDHHTSSPHPLSAVAPDARSMASHHKNRGSSTSPTPKMPSFLTLSPTEIDAKFQDIQWAERNRMVLSVTHPSPDFRWARVTGDHLKKLDRYMNIQPWQNNRVRLRVPPGKQDYINASPISLPSIARPEGGAVQDAAVGSPDRYIAMQGPKQKTVGHVWRMVVEQLESPAVIVMLTETHEGNMEKCYPYFPRSPDSAPMEVNRKDEFGDGFRASVRCEAIEETEAGDAIELRRLVVRVYKDKAASSQKGESSPDSVAEEVPAVEFPVDENGDVKMLSPDKAHDDDDSRSDGTETASVTVEVGRAISEDERPKDESPEHEYEERTVWHFLYKKWPDFGVPALEDIDSFFTLMRLSREKNADPTNPRIVHCSAGVGRSGTFIALEHLMREMDAGVLENWDLVSSRYARQQSDRAGSRAGGSDAASTEGHNGHVGDDKLEEHDAAGGGGQKMDVEEDEESDHNAGAAGDAGGEAATTELDDLIFHTVNQLREQRRHMVQAEPQFQFLYQVVRKLWEDRYGSPDNGGGGGGNTKSNRNSNSSSHHHVSTVVSEHPPRIQTPDGEPAAKRLEFDPFVEE